MPAPKATSTSQDEHTSERLFENMTQEARAAALETLLEAICDLEKTLAPDTERAVFISKRKKGTGYSLGYRPSKAGLWSNIGGATVAEVFLKFLSGDWD